MQQAYSKRYTCTIKCTVKGEQQNINKKGRKCPVLIMCHPQLLHQLTVVTGTIFHRRGTSPSDLMFPSRPSFNGKPVPCFHLDPHSGQCCCRPSALEQAHWNFRLSAEAQENHQYWKANAWRDRPTFSVCLSAVSKTLTLKARNGPPPSVIWQPFPPPFL